MSLLLMFACMMIPHQSCTARLYDAAIALSDLKHDLLELVFSFNAYFTRPQGPAIYNTTVYIV